MGIIHTNHPFPLPCIALGRLPLSTLPLLPFTEEVTGTGNHSFPVTEVLSGAGVTLLLLIIVGMLVPACKMIRRKRVSIYRSINGSGREKSIMAS